VETPVQRLFPSWPPPTNLRFAGDSEPRVIAPCNSAAIVLSLFLGLTKKFLADSAQLFNIGFGFRRNSPVRRILADWVCWTGKSTENFTHVLPVRISSDNAWRTPPKKIAKKS
jgi:hypothetical protein